MADIKKILDEIKELTVVELNELVKSLEGEFGVSAAAMAVAAPAAGGAAASAEEEKTEFNVVLKEVGPNKIQVIKVVREITGLDFLKQKVWLTALQAQSKKALAKTLQTKWLQNSKKLALLLN